MSRIPYNSKEIELLARIMRAEAIGEGVFGMKLVGNVVVNRVVATCKPFKNKNTVNEADKLLEKLVIALSSPKEVKSLLISPSIEGLISLL